MRNETTQVSELISDQAEDQDFEDDEDQDQDQKADEEDDKFLDALEIQESTKKVESKPNNKWAIKFTSTVELETLVEEDAATFRLPLEENFQDKNNKIISKHTEGKNNLVNTHNNKKNNYNNKSLESG